MDSQEVVTVEHVSKDFVLPHLRANSIKSLFTGVAYNSSTKSKETQRALRDISFEVKRGEFFGIVGRNGSGKSTMLKILAGIYQPTRGKVVTRGKLVPFIELGVGFNPELTGRENVYLNGAMLGFSRKEVETMYDDIVSFAELEKFMDQKLKNYSSGMQVRLAFSMATRSDADILLIDEVLAVGDADFQRKCYDYFKTLKKYNKTVVFVSHDMSAIREFCERGVLIEKSRVIYSGEASKVASEYERMFIEESEEAGSREGAIERSGNGAVVVKDFKLEKTLVTAKDKTLILRVELEAVRDNDDLMTGFRISNAAGQILHETNTWNEQIDLPKLPIGKSCEVTWEYPNIYTDGWYTIDLYAYGRDNTIYDMRSEVIRFQVRRPRNRGFLVSPPLKITVKEQRSILK